MDKPGSYYEQSAVIPFREQDGQREILMITSRKGKHWIVPKGIVEPGMSAQQSAAQEAWEEAGVLGQVQSACLGEYRYQKWGGMCRVVVFPMEVFSLEARWPEDFRSRQWFSPPQAVLQAAHPDLAAIIRDFCAEDRL